MKRTSLVLLVVAVVAVSFLVVNVRQASANTLLVDRGLPTANLNSSAGANQSNVSWADAESSPTPSQYWLPGDDFTLSSNSNVTDIRVWIVGAGDTAPGSLPAGLSLLGGYNNGTISTISSSYTDSLVTYANGQSYQGNSGDYWNIYQVDFTVNLSLSAGQTYDFFVNQPYVSGGGGNYYNAFLHASNAALSGSTQDGADGQFLWLDVNGTVQSVCTWDSGTGGGTCGFGAGWDKNSDANVQVFGTAPEAGSVDLLLVVLLCFGCALWRKRGVLSE